MDKKKTKKDNKKINKKESEKEPEKVETPEIAINTPQATPPQTPRKERADKGKHRGRKIKDDEIILNIKFTLIMVTTLIAKQVNNPRIIMKDKEAENFDKAIDKLILYYLPALKNHPITLLIAPIMEYAARVSIETAIDKNNKTELPKTEIKDVKVEK